MLCRVIVSQRVNAHKIRVNTRLVRSRATTFDAEPYLSATIKKIQDSPVHIPESTTNKPLMVGNIGPLRVNFLKRRLTTTKKPPAITVRMVAINVGSASLRLNLTKIIDAAELNADSKPNTIQRHIIPSPFY